MRCVIPTALEGQRLDRAISTLVGLTRSRCRALLDAGSVSCLSGDSATGSRRVSAGEVIEIDPERLAAAQQAPSADAAPEAVAGIDFAVLAEDEHIIVVDKPAGLATHPGAGHLHDTLLNGLLHRYPDISSVGTQLRPSIVHRLDAGTSGLLVCARSQLAYESLTQQLSKRSVSRRYLALVRGKPAAAQGLIDAPIGRSRRNRTKMQVRPEGREAITQYRVVGTAKCLALTPPTAALLACRLRTGRTHQIRVHLASILLPVLGDATYGCEDPFGAKRQLLHAAALGFVHPASEEPVEFAAPPPADFLTSAEALGLGAELAAEMEAL